MIEYRRYQALEGGCNAREIFLVNSGVPGGRLGERWRMARQRVSVSANSN